jgi:hypothetical protein
MVLGTQKRHLRASLGELSYSGRSRVDILQISDLEQALATAFTLTGAAERLGDGEGGSGSVTRRDIEAAPDPVDFW